ncbi:MAG: hypothetical protein WCL51_17805 [Bacteroidota bacterium]
MKRKIVLIICILITTLQMNAQLSYKTEQMSSFNEENILIQDSLQPKEKTISHKHKLSLGVMSSLDYCLFKYNGGDLLNAGENYGYHLGLKLQYNFNEKLSIRSGLTFSTFTIQGYSKKYNNRYIPLMIGYNILSIDKFFKLTPSMGFITGLNANDYMHFSSQLNLGLEFFFNSKLILTIEPYFNYKLIYNSDIFNIDRLDKIYGPYGILISVNYQL